MQGSERSGRRLGSVTAGASDTQVFQVPAGRVAQVWMFSICNSDTVPRTFTLKLNGVEIYSGETLGASETLRIEGGPDCLHGGETVQISADAAGKVKIYVSGDLLPQGI